METMKEVKVRLKKEGEALKDKLRERYQLARSLGVTSYEAKKISSWSEDRIREYAMEE